MQAIRIYLLTPFLLTLTAMPASSALVVDVSNVNVHPGQVSRVDVLVRSTDPGGTDVTLYDLNFKISPVFPTTVGPTLTFVDPQDDAFTSATNYLFHSDSAGVSASAIPGPPDNGTSLFATDFSNSFVNVNVGSTFVLLGRYEVQYNLPMGVDPSTVEGDQYVIALDASSALFTFADGKGGEMTYAGAVESLGGLATVSTIPEPATALMLAFTTGLVVVTYRRRKQAC